MFWVLYRDFPDCLSGVCRVDNPGMDSGGRVFYVPGRIPADGALRIW